MDAELVIIGDGPQRGAAEELATSLGIDDRVRFLGAVDYSRCEEELRRSHVLLLHSVTAANGDQEGLPNVLGEAMSAGLPVISTKHAGIPELVRDGETGFLVNERDEVGTSAAMMRLAESADLRMRMGMAGRRLVEQQFSETRCRTVLEGLLDGLVEDKQARRDI
jgi:colanic acid/amylovoran biosynthesis glycosyltransferase